MYLYVSDDKVDMLIERLDRSLLERFDLTFKAGVPGFGEAEASPRQPEQSRYERAERLCAALDEAGRIGSVFDEETEFFRGQLLAAWGYWNRYDKGYADVVFFHGFVDEETFVGLGGSAYHTMERASERLQQHSNSGLQTLMDFLKERSEAARSEGVPYLIDPPGAWDGEALEADHDNSVLPEPVEFVAQRLLDGPRRGIRTIIGSPVYVARTGEPTTRRVIEEYEGLRDRVAIRVHGKRRSERRYGRRELGKPSSPQPAPLREPDLTDSEEK